MLTYFASRVIYRVQLAINRVTASKESPQDTETLGNPLLARTVLRGLRS